MAFIALGEAEKATKSAQAANDLIQAFLLSKEKQAITAEKLPTKLTAQQSTQLQIHGKIEELQSDAQCANRLVPSHFQEMPVADLNCVNSRAESPPILLIAMEDSSLLRQMSTKNKAEATTTPTSSESPATQSPDGSSECSSDYSKPLHVMIGVDGPRSILESNRTFRVFCAKYDYNPALQLPNLDDFNGKLSFLAKEPIYVIGDVDSDGFYTAENSDGHSGLVPSNFVEEIWPQPPKQIFMQKIVNGSPTITWTDANDVRGTKAYLVYVNGLLKSQISDITVPEFEIPCIIIPGKHTAIKMVAVGYNGSISIRSTQKIFRI